MVRARYQRLCLGAGSTNRLAWARYGQRSLDPPSETNQPWQNRSLRSDFAECPNPLRTHRTIFPAMTSSIPKPVSVLIVEDSVVVRARLRALLAEERSINVVAEA